MEEEKKEKGFVIKDRRHFDESGAVRKDEEAKTEAKQAEAPKEKEKSRPAPQDPADDAQTGPLPEMSFAGFIFSLSTSAMYHFGDFPDPVTKESRRNLPAAKQTIDILSILKTKTEGNLDAGEKEMLDGILFELRMRYVKEMSGK